MKGSGRCNSRSSLELDNSSIKEPSKPVKLSMHATDGSVRKSADRRIDFDRVDGFWGVSVNPGSKQATLDASILSKHNLHIDAYKQTGPRIASYEEIYRVVKEAFEKENIKPPTKKFLSYGQSYGIKEYPEFRIDKHFKMENGKIMYEKIEGKSQTIWTIGCVGGPYQKEFFKQNKGVTFNTRQEALTFLEGWINYMSKIIDK